MIGAGRSGTTSFFDYVAQHPEVNASKIKEVIYFSIEEQYAKGEAYLSSFFNKQGEKKINFTSDTYLLSNLVAAQRIKEHNPAIKLLVILRDPSERSFSSYQYARNNGHEKTDISFTESLNREAVILSQENIVKQTNLCHFEGSLYAKHLTMWTDIFSKEQLFIATTLELKSNPEALMSRYFEFAGLSPYTIEVHFAKNKAAKAKNKALHQFLINRDHPIRKIVRKPLQIPFIKNTLIKSGVVDKVKSMNMADASYIKMTDDDMAFCNSYFKEDLELLKTEFGISF